MLIDEIEIKQFKNKNKKNQPALTIETSDISYESKTKPIEENTVKKLIKQNSKKKVKKELKKRGEIK